MRRFLRENGLSLTLATLFGICLVGQTVAGQREYNQNRQEHGQTTLGYGEYLASGHSLEAVFENWESEFLQMGFYVILTVFLRQKGSSESKKLAGKEQVDEDPRKRRRDPEAPLPVRTGGLALRLYEHSLSLSFIALFVTSFALHAWFGLALYNEELADHGQMPVGLSGYLGGSRFWFESFQNWQSEFLAVGSIVVLSIFLRERGSPESKPVASSHHETGKG